MLGSILTHVQMEYSMENSKYFYSDYIRGVDFNCGVNVALSGLSLSMGSDIVMNKDRFTVQWQLGLGISISKEWLIK